MVKHKNRKFVASMLSMLFFGGITQAATKNEIKSSNVVNITQKQVSLLKIFGIMAGSFVGLAGAVALSAYLYFKIEDKKFKNTDAGKKSESYKEKCEKIDNLDISKKEKKMEKQRLWAEYYIAK